MGNMRFYCRDCNKVIDRRHVIPKTWEDSYRCRWCGSTVYRTRKLLAGILNDYVEYLEKKGEDLDQYE